MTDWGQKILVYMNQNYDVFISYSRRDYTDENNQIIPGNIISQIKDMFDVNNISYWFDEDGVFSGDAFAPIIARNIKSSSIFLFISSENSNISEWTSNEIATAHTYKKKIIPFKYDNSVYNDSVIIYIARLDYIDYPTNPDKSLQRLLLSVQTYLKEEAAKKEKARLEEEIRRKAEISRQERAAKIQGIHDKLEKLENRKFEIEKDILEKEKSLTDLRNEKRIVETNISELLEEESIITGHKSNTIESTTKNSSNKQNTPKNNTRPNFFVSRLIELKSSMALKHWSVNLIHLLVLISYLLAFPLILVLANKYMEYACAFAILATVIGLYLLLKNIRYGFFMTIIPNALLIILTVIRNQFVPQKEETIVLFIVITICLYLICIPPLLIRKHKRSAWAVLKKQPINLRSISIWAYLACIIAMIVITLQ